MTKAEEKQFIRAAKRATAGLNESKVMVGFLNEHEGGVARWEFALQVGHCLLASKPVLLIVPRGQLVPQKLVAAATACEYYTPGDMESAQQAVQRALTVAGIEKAH